MAEETPRVDKRMEKSRRLYREALDRLKRGVPHHPNLQAVLRKGKGYAISPSTVALEAGKSRNPLYTTHKDLLAEIEAATGASEGEQKPTKRVGAARDRIRDLVATVELLKAEKAKLATQNLALLVRLSKANKRAERLERDKARLAKRLARIVGIHAVHEDDSPEP